MYLEGKYEINIVIQHYEVSREKAEAVGDVGMDITLQLLALVVDDIDVSMDWEETIQVERICHV